jgi:CHAD domain-containing protein
MAAGKWISDLTPSTPVLDAARHALTIRLETVRSQLEEAHACGASDVESVHQLRVSTRRARAALDLFTTCLPKKVSKKVRRRLRKLRRLAGEIRDWDVFLLNLKASGSVKYRKLQATLDLVNGLALNQRETARVALTESKQSLPFKFERLASTALASLHAPGSVAAATLGDAAVPILTERITDLRDAAASAGSELAQFHRIRIAAKHLRYAMEIFGDCFEREFKESIYPLVEQMQEILGNLHDSDLANQRLEQWRIQCERTLPADWPRYRPGFEELRKRHEASITAERRKFRAAWRRWEKTGLVDRLEKLRANSQRGELVSTAGSDNTAPGVRDPERSAPVGRTVAG